ncbi:MAG: sulfotransferase [Xenococcaceae cyanobacterium MO_188.B19]|nr:sulfotransferase [Xenococcaceae cyanobacterium MO_188.B19]
MSLISEPIFLVGAERSGTTLLRLMLRSHSQLSWCNEFEYSVDLIPNEQELPILDDYYKWLATHRIFRATNFRIDRGLDYPQLVNSFLAQKKTIDSKPLVGATVHRHFDRLLRIWPKAKFIHIVRDGRDVARSCIGMGWAGNVWTGIERWIEAENLWADMKQSLPKEQQIEITYESLIYQPDTTLKKLCDFIGINFESEMLNYHKTSSYDSPDPKLLNQWQHKLSDREIQLVESRISHMLVERNYELSGLPLIKVDNLLEQQLRLQCLVKARPI